MKNSTQKAIKYLLFIIVIFFIGDRILSNTIAHFVLKSGTKFSRVYRGNEKNDIVILGNSRGDSSFSPNDIYKKTGLSTFQLSHKGISTEIVECLWKDYLKNNIPPQILLLEITSLSTPNDALADLKSFMYWSKDFSNLLKRENYKSFLISKLSKLYIWNGEIVFRSLYYIGKSDQNKITINTKFINDTIADILLEKHKKNETISVKNKNIESFYRILRIAKENDVTVHIIFPPYVPEYVDIIETSKIELLRNITSNISKYGHVYVHDLSRSITDLSMFTNLTHTNYKGSKELLKILIEKDILEAKKI